MTERQRQDVQILTISIDDHQTSRRFVQNLKKNYPGTYDFPFLEDKNHKVIDRYGLLNPEGHGWPHPATYVIDKRGVVRWRFVEVDYTKQPSKAQILEALRSVR